MSTTDVITFMKSVYEFFRNDFSLVEFFLGSETTWDKNFLYEFSLDKEALLEMKNVMFVNIISGYHNYVFASSSKGTLSPLMKRYLKKIEASENPSDFFFTDEEMSVGMQRFMVNRLVKLCDISIDTTNYYEPNFFEVGKICSEVYAKYDVSQIESLDENGVDVAKRVSEEIYTKVTSYLSSVFDSPIEEIYFLSYLYSLFYSAYTMNSEGINDEDAKKIKDIMDKQLEIIKRIDPKMLDSNKDISIKLASQLRSLFYQLHFIAPCLIDIISFASDIYSANFDYRKKVDDQFVQKYFSLLDVNYNVKFPPFRIINTFNLDKKIENLLDMLRCDWDTEEIYSFLIDSDIREFLLDNDLDARDTRYFRMAFINKIIGDVYEFESYNRVIKNIEIEKGVYQQFYYQISNIIDDAAKRLNFFVEHGVDLLNSYYFYHRQGDDFINQVQTYIYESKYFDTLLKINAFASTSYLPIQSCNYQKLHSAEYLNQLFLLDKGSNYIINNIDSFEREKQELVIRTICLSVYEHLILEQNKDESMNAFLSFLENKENIVDFILSDRNCLKKMIDLFHYYNSNGITSYNENKIRKQIKDAKHVKVLERLNPFFKEEKDNYGIETS